MNETAATELLALVTRAEPLLLGREASAWVERLDRHADEYDDACTTLTAAGRHDDALRLAAGLRIYAQAVGRVDEVRALVEKVLRTAPSDASPALGPALLTQGVLAFRQRDQEVALTATRAALAIAEMVGDASLQARAELNLARIAFRDDDAERIRRHAERALQLGGSDLRLAAGGRHMLAWAAYSAGDVDRAVALFDENVAAYRELDDMIEMAGELGNIADLLAESGDLEGAATSLRSALEACADSGDVYMLSSLLLSAAALALRRGRHEEGFTLEGAAERQYVDSGLTPDPGEGITDDQRAAAETIVGREASRAARERGRHLELAAAVDVAVRSLA